MMNVTPKIAAAAACIGILAGSAFANENCYYDGESARRLLICPDSHEVFADFALVLPVGAVAQNYDGFGRRLLGSLMPGVKTAGDTLDGWAVDVIGSHTSFDDSALAVDGESNSLSLQLSANHGDNVVGLGLTANVLDIENGAGIDTTTIDGYYGVTASDNFTIGVLGSVSFVEPDGGVSDEQYGLGGFVAGSVELSDMFSLGGVTAVSYLDGIGQSEWLWNSVVDLSAQLCQHSNVSLYVGHTETLESSPLDGYITLGAEITWTISDATALSVAYEQTAEHDTLDDETYVIQLSHSF